jgi:hypothetical protein
VLNKYQNILAWALGIGIASFAFRSYYYPGLIIGLVTCVVVLFIMAVFILNDRERPKNVLGSKFVYIPLAIIALSIIFSAIVNYTTADALFMQIIIAVVFFGVYLACRILGEKVFKPFAVAVVVEAASVVVNSLILHYGIHNGGFSSILDYNTAIALMSFGAVVAVFYKQWVIVTIASVGIFFTGSEEGILVLAIILLAIIIRRDFSKKILLPIGLVAVIVVLGVIPFNYTKMLYAVPIDKVTMILYQKHNEESLAVTLERDNHTDVANPENFEIPLDYPLNGRIRFSKIAIDNWNWLGSGYVLNPVDSKDFAAYNVPLVVAQQTGIWSGIVWVFVTIYCLVKTKWKYAFVALIALSLVDNFVWCQLGIFWWALIGVSTVSERKSDLMFRGVR